jgi:SOS-response transcriptional repressor LexA
MTTEGNEYKVQPLRGSSEEIVYAFICSYIGNEGMAPSIREIAEHCFMSRGSVSNCLTLLEARGFIRRYPHKARSIRLTSPTDP